MVRRKKTKGRSLIHTDSYWQQIVENRIPLVGGWFREIAAVRLAESARSGSRQAAQSLARALDCNPTDRVREIARQALVEIGSGGIWNAVWEVWLESRPIELGNLLLQRNLSATHPPDARVYSHLLLGKDDLLIKAGPEVVPALVEAASEQDPELTARARHALAQLTNPASRQALYEFWSEQRKPWQEELLASADDTPQPPHLRVLVLLRRGRYEALIDDGPEVVQPLVQACADRDDQIARNAVFALRLLRKPDTLAELCRLWAKDRQPVLEEIILQKGVIAESPPEVRLQTALLIGRVDIAQKIPPQHLDALIAAAADPDERITTHGLEALAALTHAETREAVCDRVIDGDDPLAKQASLQGGYLPDAPDRRALFLFLTGQWDAYAALDFDQRILRTVYTAAPPPLRQRISSAVLAAGRIDFVRILTGLRDNSRRTDWSDDEIRLLVTMLSREQQWDRLWGLVFEVPLAWSVEIIHLLTQNGWQPQPAVLTIFQQLSQMASSLPAVAQSNSLYHLPVAIKAETICVKGRVNDIAFSPTGPLLAIGTGQRQVVLWDYKRGEISAILRGFEHSISRVVFNSAGILFTAERSSPDGPCLLAMWDGSEMIHLGQHDQSITDLYPLGDDRLLSAGNDRRIVLWDLANRRQLAAATLPRNAPRAQRLLVSTDRQRVYYVHERISFLSLPELNRYQEFYSARSANPSIKRSTGRCAAFLPPNGDLAVGQHNGQLICYRSVPVKTYRVKHLLATHVRQVQEVRWLPERSMIVSAGGEGEVRFTRWPDGERVDSVEASKNWLTTMDISLDSSFMVTGSSDSSLTLWDLRTDRLARIMKQPLGSAQPADLALLNAVIASGADLDREVSRALEYMQALLQHRLRFDIEVVELATIHPGTFDIQLDEVGPKNG